MSITFTVSGLPKPQPRPRAFARKMGNKFVARVFESGTAEGWKSLVALAAKPHTPPTPFVGPVLVNITFIFPRPNAHFRGNKPEKGLRADAPQWHVNRPDRDNSDKAILDCLTQLGGFWRDDCQVCDGFIRKIYGVTPGAIIEIKPLDTQPVQLALEGAA
jgi:crossover junction endodeoxyribonuclease RusA